MEQTSFNCVAAVTIQVILEPEKRKSVTDFRICFPFFPCLLVMRASQVGLVVKNLPLPANAGDLREGV